jgi:ABC-2 type transport system permease protein
MNGFLTMIKMNLKLLLRNKGYLIFLIILPILSVFMLDVKNINVFEGKKDNYEVLELESKDSEILSMVNTKLSVKVFDCSKSEVSNYIAEELARTGSYNIYRYRSEPMDQKEAEGEALNSANSNVIGAVIYIPDTFESELLAGKGSNIVVYEATKDARINLLKSNLNTYLQSIASLADMVGYDKAALVDVLRNSMEKEMRKEIVSIEVGDTLNLTANQQDQSASIGYSLAFLTIAFLFSGVFIASTVVQERKNRVYNRVLLSEATIGNYGLVKLILIVITVFIQTAIIAVAIKLIVGVDFGIPFASYLFFVFCLGLIFNTLSVVIGVLTNNVITSNYIAFLIWCISDLLAGLYFPLDAASGWWEKVSLMMPQRWIVKSSEMLMAGKSGVYLMYILVVMSFLLIFMSIGAMGIRIRRKE